MTTPHLTDAERAMLADLEVTHGADVATAQLLVLDAYRHGRSDALAPAAQARADDLDDDPDERDEGLDRECHRCQAILLDSGHCWYCDLGNRDRTGEPL